MLVEVFASIGVGLVARSLALLAFGGDSLIELISGVAVLAQLKRRVVEAPNDYNESIERVASALLFLLIPVIGLGAAFSYVTGLRPEGSLLGVAVALAAMVMMPYLYVMKRRIGR
jgi:divalent metal cation (Fe/Co/Zn/Cd) transporter